ncbi:MAG TPA: FlgD immunoglobulin-like domain containing protein [Candidatus Kapabacteria bacterium]|nr:FlgD immunoglobulin-like domain containing protein [Candidatus Kapabacteria bacterium]
MQPLPSDRMPTGLQGADELIPRRRFMRTVALAAGCGALLPRVLRAGNGSGACAPTTPDIEGPFYLSGSPFQIALARQDEPGERLSISGIVYANDCATPIAGAVVDVWAANNDGCYNNNNECSPHSDDRFNLRGRMLTDQQGAYAFSTVKPGRYLNGATYRPSHVHFKINAPGRPIVTTQLYFESDPYIPVDQWASDPASAGRIIPLTANSGTLTGVFNITLDVPPGESGISYSQDTARALAMRCSPNPFSGNAVITYAVRTSDRVDIGIHDITGRRVRALVSSVHGTGVYSERWDGLDDAGRELPSGVYMCRLRSGGCVEAMQIVLAK